MHGCGLRPCPCGPVRLVRPRAGGVGRSVSGSSVSVGRNFHPWMPNHARCGLIARNFHPGTACASPESRALALSPEPPAPAASPPAPSNHAQYPSMGGSSSSAGAAVAEFTSTDCIPPVPGLERSAITVHGWKLPPRSAARERPEADSPAERPPGQSLATTPHTGTVRRRSRSVCALFSTSTSGPGERTGRSRSDEVSAPLSVGSRPGRRGPKSRTPR
jgi:hypothetical protein